MLNAEAYQFAHFSDPVYPPLARQARIQGKVELHLSVDSATGAVLGVSAVSGQRILTPSVIDAAKLWRFVLFRNPFTRKR
ncbi:MAG: energy transducer TonB [Acidobacteriia bacterium]|nr:energy transducer TonB [Terriglobia bacterium]